MAGLDAIKRDDVDFLNGTTVANNSSTTYKHKKARTVLHPQQSQSMLWDDIPTPAVNKLTKAISQQQHLSKKEKHDGANVVGLGVLHSRIRAFKEFWPKKAKLVLKNRKVSDLDWKEARTVYAEMRSTLGSPISGIGTMIVKGSGVVFKGIERGVNNFTDYDITGFAELADDETMQDTLKEASLDWFTFEPISPWKRIVLMMGSKAYELADRNAKQGVKRKRQENEDNAIPRDKIGVEQDFEALQKEIAQENTPLSSDNDDDDGEDLNEIEENSEAEEKGDDRENSDVEDDYPADVSEQEELEHPEKNNE
jgi:hypothetical protein